jgi:hypothetical protein
VPTGRIAAIGTAVMVVLFLAFDAGLGDAPPPPPIVSVALGVLALLFGAGAWVMRVGGRAERAPLLAGLAGGTGLYALLRLTLAG